MRATEPDELAPQLEAAGVPIVGRLYGAAQADGGDLCWLDERTLIAGRGYRTNAEAHRQLAEARWRRDGAELLRADLPHDRGAAHVLHLLSVVSPVADDLAVVYEPPGAGAAAGGARRARRAARPRRPRRVRDARLQRAARCGPAWWSWSTATRGRGARWRRRAARCTPMTAPSSRSRATAGRRA